MTIHILRRLLKELNVLPCACLDIQSIAQKTAQWTERDLEHLINLTYNQSCLEVIQTSYLHNIRDRFNPYTVCLNTPRFLRAMSYIDSVEANTCHRKDQCHLDRMMAASPYTFHK